MIALAWQTFRARWVSFAGSFLALALGVALFASAGLTLAAVVSGPDDPPRWHVAPSVVVAGPSGAGVTPDDPDGPPLNPPLPPGERGFVPPEVVAMLSVIDGAAAVIVDRAGYAQFGAATEAHPWAASALHPFEFVIGVPPTDDDHVVLTTPTDVRAGEVISVATVDGPQPFTVSGVIDASAEPALYVTDATARRLARDRIAAVALLPESGVDLDALAEEARAALDALPIMRVLTGDDRRGAELDPEAGLEIAAVSLVGSTAGLAGFVAIFVVGGTFAFAVAQRRREFALLRAVGATARQVRRLVVGEALLVGILAGLAGAILGAVLAPPFAWWLARNGLAPTGFATEVVWWPLVTACGLGLVVALAGSWLPARRASTVRPIEALREASIEAPRMTIARWVLGLACLGGVIPVTSLMSGPAGAAYLLLVVMLLIMGCALLLPVLIRPFAWLATSGRGPIAMLTRASTRTERRRYASTVAPVLITIGLAGGALVGTATIAATEAAALRDQLTASLMVAPADEARLPAVAAGQVRSIPGVAAATPVKTTTVFDSHRDMIGERSAWYIDGPSAPLVLRLPVVAGSFDDLIDTTVAVTTSVAEAHGWQIGDQARLWLGDGALTELEIVAVFSDRLGLPGVFLPWSLATTHSTSPLPDAVYLALTPQVDRAVLEAAVGTLGGTVADIETHLASIDEQFDRLSRLSLLAILGMALVYTAISIANTQVMATTGRARELLTLRKIGATRRQIVHLVGREAITVGAIGTVIGGIVTVATLITVHVALGGMTDSVPTEVPWLVTLAITVCCGAITLVASVAPVSRVLRSHTGVE